MEIDAKFAERLSKLRLQKGVSARQMSLDIGESQGISTVLRTRRIILP